MSSPDFHYDEDIYIEEIIQPIEMPQLVLPVNGSSVFQTLFFNIKDNAQLFTSSQLTETEKFHYQANMLFPTDIIKTINTSNMLTPKFIQAECFYNTPLDSAPQTVFKVVAILQSETDNTIHSTVGSGVIVLKAIDFYHAFITSQTLHPPEYRNHKMKIISITAKIHNKKCDCSIIDEGNYVLNYSSENDWALLKIKINSNMKKKNFKVAIPSPSIRKSLSQHGVGSGFPDEYNTLLFGYFTKNETVEQCESKRVKELGLEISDIWKIVPQHEMSGSLGWIYNSACQSGDFYNCGSTNSCSGGPVFQCSLNIEEVLKAEEQDKHQMIPRSTTSLLNNTKLENRLIGIHCGGHKDDGNVFCSVDNFFESYFKNVYSPHKKYFSQSEIQLIEHEWELFNSKD